jgi:hypothetical protein
MHRQIEVRVKRVRQTRQKISNHDYHEHPSVMWLQFCTKSVSEMHNIPGEVEYTAEQKLRKLIDYGSFLIIHLS